MTKKYLYLVWLKKKKTLKKGRRKNKAMFIVKFTQSRLEKCQMSNLEEGS